MTNATVKNAQKNAKNIETPEAKLARLMAEIAETQTSIASAKFERAKGLDALFSSPKFLEQFAEFGIVDFAGVAATCATFQSKGSVMPYFEGKETKTGSGRGRPMIDKTLLKYKEEKDVPAELKAKAIAELMAGKQVTHVYNETGIFTRILIDWKAEATKQADAAKQAANKAGTPAK